MRTSFIVCRLIFARHHKETHNVINIHVKLRKCIKEHLGWFHLQVKGVAYRERKLAPANSEMQKVSQGALK